MPTLHIEHSISDFETWSQAFNRFAEVRANAGVLASQVRRPVDDPRYVVVDLDFDTTDAAAAFLGFLQTKIWATPANSPALVGSPSARVLEDAVVG